MGSGTAALSRVVQYIVNPFLLLVFACGVFLFMLGLVQYMYNLSKGADTKDGKMHMLWGVVGMLIMVSFYGILAIISNTFQLGVDPRNPGNYQPNVGAIQNINTGANFFGP